MANSTTALSKLKNAISGNKTETIPDVKTPKLDVSTEHHIVIPTIKKKRGRPKKTITTSQSDVSNTIISDISSSIKKKRGRPKKASLSVNTALDPVLKKNTRKLKDPEAEEQKKLKKINAWKSPLYKLNVLTALGKKDRIRLNYIQTHPKYMTINSADLVRRLFKEKYEELKNL